ncbi:MAG: hypothetical protein IPL96_07375 [Holophagaceae bacterium]|nr:hypothetical protein [Holophagaceae bacterium]
MPIYAPTLPPRENLDRGSHPIAVLMRFDFGRVMKAKLGIFFGFLFLLILLIQLGSLYLRYLSNTSVAFSGMKDFASQILTQGPEYQADHLGQAVLIPMWFQVALIGGGLVARDTLHRIRPLIYAHPVRPQDYLLAKGGLAALLPFAIQLPFVLIPWAMSLMVAGKNGPIWTTLPLHLIPAALMIAILAGSVTLGASAMAGSPRAGFGWVLGIVLGTFALGGILAGLLKAKAFLAISPVALATAWPQLLCGMKDPFLDWVPTVIGTVAHVSLWIFVAAQRTKPSEAVL